MQPIDHQQKEKIKIAEVKAKIRAKSNSSRFPVDKLGTIILLMNRFKISK